MESKQLGSNVEVSTSDKPGVFTGGDVQCHCTDGHEKCIELAKRRRGCLCDSLLWINCSLGEEVPEQIWNILLSFKLVGLIYDFCGFVGKTRCAVRSCGAVHGYVYMIVIRVESSKDRNTICDLLHRRCMTVRIDEFDSEYYLPLICNKSCCVDDFFKDFDLLEQDGKVSDFGDRDVLADVQALNLERLAIR